LQDVGGWFNLVRNPRFKVNRGVIFQSSLKEEVPLCIGLIPKVFPGNVRRPGRNAEQEIRGAFPVKVPLKVERHGLRAAFTVLVE
jgi:hypothetical protein